MSGPNRQRVWIYSLLVVFILSIVGREAWTTLQLRKSMEMIRPRLAADPRYARVKLQEASIRHPVLSGFVATEADREALRTLVKEINPPRRTLVAVNVQSDQP